MSTRDRIVAELDRMSEEELEVVLVSIRRILKTPTESDGLFERLKHVRIDGPPDFASHADDYVAQPPGQPE
ncbi:MAG: hypothetical protein AAGG50_04145 [Bacteroidota bacterium]